MQNKLFQINKQIVLLILVILFQGINPIMSTAGNDPKYKVSDIPKELKSGAIAVIRNQETTFVRSSISNGVLKVTEVITILNKKALNYSYFSAQYDKFSKIKNIKAVIYDEFGNVVKKISKDDIMDISAISGGTLFSDARVKYINPKYRTVPFTVEYTYEEVYSGLLNTPIWQVYPGYKISIEKSSFSVTTSSELQLRFFQRHLDVLPKKTVDKDKITYYWEVNNLVAIKNEPFSLSLFETSPLVFSSPSDFLMENEVGNIESWENFGKWRSQLLEDRGELPDETKQELISMKNDTLNEIETIKMYYNWMQNKTRYVSIQEGIGGWQPMLAEEVDRFSYGDCKALSNYMMAILKVVDINSYYTIVVAGHSAREWIVEFPSNQSNHAILCVPVENDTIWLECTSQQNPFGYLGDFTDDRDVLLMTENGGKIAHTTSYNKDDNFKNTYATVLIDDFGDGEATINISNNGLYYDDLVPILLSTEKDQKEMVVDDIDIPSFELENYSFSETKSMIPVVNEKIELKIKSYGTKLGKRMLFEVNLLNKSTYQFKRTGKRRNDIVIRREYKKSDTIVYNLPSNYSVEALPSAIELVSEFGSYSSKVIQDSTQITYIRNFEMNKGHFPSSKFADFKKFSADIRNADMQKVVLINNTN